MKRWIFGILIVSAIFRIGFVASGDVLPVMWDARRYTTAALGLISYVDTSATQLVADEREGRYQFKHYYEKYIQGEQIKWFHYTPHSLTQARDELFVSGPLYPFFLAIIFFLAPIADFTFARLFGIVLDLLSNWLLILVALRLVGRRAAVIAGCLYAAYFPFVLASSMLLLETSTSFLILLTMYCLIRAFEDDRRKLYIVAGILTGLLILNKPTAML
ncbi:MAG: glycosyltransferase family 39 protein, partial [candidate division Zixibacteria bacterium]|nr:glycosyltransferase family 39 protein [candidate division Zixibacteria bacterium]